MPRLSVIIIILSASILFSPSQGRAGEETATCIYQDVVRELSKGQPALKGTQRICFTPTAVRNETTYSKYTTVAIVDLKAGEISLIPGNQHQYAQMHLVDYRKLVKMRLGAVGLDDPDLKASLAKTQKEKTIRSWTCHLYTFEQGGKIPVKGDIWIAHDTGVDFSQWFNLMDKLGLLSSMGSLGKQAAELDGLPISVRIEQTVFDQRLVTTTEVTSIKTDQPIGDLFTIPAGYKRIEAGSMSGFSE